MSSLRGLTEKELSDLMQRADERMVHQFIETQQDVDAGRISPEQGDYRMQDILDASKTSKHEIEVELFRREKNRILGKKIFSATAVLFGAIATYFVFFK